MDPMTLSTKTTIWSSVCEDLVDQYDILWAGNLLDHDDNMEGLRHELCFLKSHIFTQNQRLIFSLYDVEYYLTGSKIGFTIENLVRLLINLDISPDHCMLFTNHHGIKNSIANIYPGFGIKIFENNFCHFSAITNPIVLERSANNITRHFCFMSNTRRDHRSYIRLWLEDQQLTKQTALSWHSSGVTSSTQSEDNKNKVAVKPTDNTGPCFFVYNRPFTRLNDKINVTNDCLTSLYNKHADILNNDHRDELITFGPRVDNFYVPWLSNVFINIVSETVFDYPYPYLSEKTFKCFWHCSPFIIVGGAGSLKYLKSIGFRTFDNWFDESYDSIANPEQRMLALLNVISSISKWSLDQCQDVYNEMKPVLDHNLAHYQNYFCGTLLQGLKEELHLS